MKIGVQLMHFYEFESALILWRSFGHLRAAEVFFSFDGLFTYTCHAMTHVFGKIRCCTAARDNFIPTAVEGCFIDF